MLPHKLRARLSGLDIHPNAPATIRMRLPSQSPSESHQSWKIMGYDEFYGFVIFLGQLSLFEALSVIFSWKWYGNPADNLACIPSVALGAAVRGCVRSCSARPPTTLLMDTIQAGSRIYTQWSYFFDQDITKLEKSWMLPIIFPRHIVSS